MGAVMYRAKYTAGPWEPWAHKRVRCPMHSHGVSAEGRAQCDVADVVAFEGHPEESEANARLIASAPAMDLALLLICCGLARIERTGPLVEFCFDGLRYVHHGDWNALLGAIGWDKARAALPEIKGGV